MVTFLPTYGPLNEIAWTAKDRLSAPADVGLKKPHEFGAHDMLGNVRFRSVGPR
jgi:formylglycine-generating enzyme